MNLSEKAMLFNRLLLASREQILTVLTKIETRQTAEDEWNRAVACFHGLESQEPYLLAGEVNSVASFLPLNQPLYSFILFVVVPSFTAKNAIFRPPLLLWNVFTDLMSIFEKVISGKITMCQVTRRDFLEKYVSCSDVVIFTGEYENAMNIRCYLKPSTLFLFNGGALNPMIITETANIATAVRDVIRERLFNSGQDCMAPCAILINRKIASEFMHILYNNLDKEVVGLNESPTTTVGQMLDVGSIMTAKAIIESYQANLVFGGKYDEVIRIISPTVFLFNSIDTLPQRLIFAPLYFVGVYDGLSDLEKYLMTETARELSGYISIYTNSTNLPIDVDRLGYYQKQILVNESLFVYESANKEFGGYGKRCSFIMKDGKMQIRPLLISREIAEYFY